VAAVADVSKIDRCIGVADVAMAAGPQAEAGAARALKRFIAHHQCCEEPSILREEAMCLGSAGVPTVDIATTCRESERAITSIFGPGTQQTFDSCMKQENDARGQIVKNWRSYPSGGRQRCVNTTGYMPSYVEWLTCIEKEQSVEALRRSNFETTRPSSTKLATTEGRSER
jgi:hypothetical protein